MLSGSSLWQSQCKQFNVKNSERGHWAKKGERKVIEDGRVAPQNKTKQNKKQDFSSMIAHWKITPVTGNLFQASIILQE